MNVPDRLGIAGRARRVHPERNLVRHGRRGERCGLRPCQQVLEEQHVLQRGLFLGASTEEKAALQDVLFFEDLLAGAQPTPFTAATMSDEVAFWMYTSGSTGDPKAVRHVHTSLMATATLMGQGVIGLREDDVVFSAAKLSFSYGLGNAVSFPMS